MDIFLDILLNILLLPLQLILIPIDLLLDNIPGIGTIPSIINDITSFIGSVPSTLVNLFGIHPFIWNALFGVFLLYIAAAPAIQAIKKVWAWVRP